jgi:hypothetical protein
MLIILLARFAQAELSKSTPTAKRKIMICIVNIDFVFDVNSIINIDLSTDHSIGALREGGALQVVRIEPL